MNSMTGFGRAGAGAENYSLTVEIKSVNHRFLDVSFKMPQLYAQCESRLLKEIRGSVKRGHLDVIIVRKNVFNSCSESFCTTIVNQSYLEHYITTAKQVIEAAKANEAEVMPLVLANLIDKRDLTKSDLSSEDSARAAEELTADDQDLVLQTLQEALVGLLRQRREEGESLKKVLQDLLSKFVVICSDIKCVSAEIPQKFQERLKMRLQSLAPEVDISPDRLAQEIAILADRIDITEEQVRLESHCSAFAAVAGFSSSSETTDERGRKMDFLIQEMGREVNTIGSKAQDSEVGRLVVEAKAILEKMREQVQNIE